MVKAPRERGYSASDQAFLDKESGVGLRSSDVSGGWVWAASSECLRDKVPSNSGGMSAPG